MKASHRNIVQNRLLSPIERLNIKIKTMVRRNEYR